MAYAKIAVKCFMVHLVRHFRIGTPYKSLEELKPIQTVTMRFANGHQMWLEKRE